MPNNGVSKKSSNEEILTDKTKKYDEEKMPKNTDTEKSSKKETLTDIIKRYGDNDGTLRPIEEIKSNLEKERDKKILSKKEMDEKILPKKEMEEEFISNKGRDEKILSEKTEINNNVPPKKPKKSKGLSKGTKILFAVVFPLGIGYLVYKAISWIADKVSGGPNNETANTGRDENIRHQESYSKINNINKVPDTKINVDTENKNIKPELNLNLKSSLKKVQDTKKDVNTENENLKQYKELIKNVKHDLPAFLKKIENDCLTDNKDGSFTIRKDKFFDYLNKSINMHYDLKRYSSSAIGKQKRHREKMKIKYLIDVIKGPYDEKERTSARIELKKMVDNIQNRVSNDSILENNNMVIKKLDKIANKYEEIANKNEEIAKITKQSHEEIQKYNSDYENLEKDIKEDKKLLTYGQKVLKGEEIPKELSSFFEEEYVFKDKIIKEVENDDSQSVSKKGDNEKSSTPEDTKSGVNDSSKNIDNIHFPEDTKNESLNNKINSLGREIDLNPGKGSEDSKGLDGGIHN